MNCTRLSAASTRLPRFKPANSSLPAGHGQGDRSFGRFHIVALQRQKETKSRGAAPPPPPLDDPALAGGHVAQFQPLPLEVVAPGYPRLVVEVQGHRLNPGRAGIGRRKSDQQFIAPGRSSFGASIRSDRRLSGATSSAASSPCETTGEATVMRSKQRMTTAGTRPVGTKPLNLL